MSLVEETKKHIGYIDHPALTCNSCTHSVEEDHPVLDRSWIMYCTISNLVKFQVVESGTCQRHTPRVAKSSL